VNLLKHAKIKIKIKIKNKYLKYCLFLIVMNNIAFYCINFNDEDRKNRMIQRFINQNINLNFVKPVYKDDQRITNIQVCDFTKRVMSIMLQHMDSISDFYENTEDEYCIICEDDIFISKKLNTYFNIIF